MNDCPIDVLIICALPLELKALVEVCEGVAEAWVEVDDLHYTATLAGQAGPIRVAAASTTKTSGVPAAIVATRLSESLKPRCLAMCGVCAGHPDDTDLGDVIIADRVFQHDVGKHKSTGIEGDITTHNLDGDWHRAALTLVGPAKQFHGYGEPEGDEAACTWFLERLVDGYEPQASGFARYFRGEHGVQLLEHLEECGHVELTDVYTITPAGALLVNQRRRRRKSIEVERVPYHIHVGPIGSGNYVVADGSAWERLPKAGMRRILGIEQEAAAIGEVAHDHRIPFIVAKGVMDHAWPSKNDRFKKFAARASAEVFCAFLRRVIEPGREPPADPPERSPEFEYPTPERRFTGRSRDLADLERLILANESVCVVATGIGGIGKTTLVSQFVATRGRGLFPDGVAWIDGSPERFASELARVSVRFGWKQGREPTPQEAVAWLKDKLAGKRVLIVVDNLDPKYSEPEHVPIPGRSARTIVTSRTHTLDEDLPGAARLPLKLWSPEVCRNYLRDNCRDDWPAVRTASDAELNDLAKFVGHLPLGMRLLVSVLRRRSHLSPAELLAKLRAQPLGTLDQFDKDRGVAATFGVAYEDLEDPERRVLQALAACAKQTRAEIVAAVADADLDEVRESLGYLRTHGFAEQPEHGVWGMHDVVRMFVLAQPGIEDFERRQLGWVVRHLFEHAEPTAYREFAEGVEEAKHAFSRWLSRYLKIAGAIYFPLNKHLTVVGRYADAVQLSESFLGAAAPDSREAAAALGHLGLCYETLNDVAKAIDYHERSLAIDEKLGYIEGQAISLGNLGLCYQTLGDLPNAIEYFERALAIDTKLGNLAGQANHLGNLGGCYRSLGDLPKAIEYHERALAMDEKLGRLEGQANQLGNLGVCYLSLKDIPEAIEYLERSLAINTKLGYLEGQANQLGNLGVCYLELDDIPKAIEYLERALTIDEELGRLGGQASNLGNLGVCYLSLKDIPEAIEYLERSLTLEKKLGRLEGQANQLHNLGVCHAQLGEPATALDFLTRARALYRRMGLSEDHWRVVRIEQLLTLLR